MDARQQRGLVIAALCKLNKTDGEWLVPSQSGGERIYRVNPSAQTCSCPDHQEAGHKCKHLFAVEFTMQREVAADGTTTETKSITFTEKVTYSQPWSAYNRAQSIEKDRLQELLFDLCREIEGPTRAKTGRPPHSYRDSVFAMVTKVYETLSSRRVDSDLRQARERGFLSRTVPGVKVLKFFENPVFTPILRTLIGKSAAPLRPIETKFAIDSSGFGTCRHERWFDEKYGVTRRRSVWIKAHICCGTKTNIVTAVRILDKDSADCPEFTPLVRETARHFAISEVSADKAYGSLENFETVADCGGLAFIAFKSNNTGAAGGTFAKMFHYFQYKRDEYMARYHQRSNVESTFSMVKRKFGDAVRSRTDTAMTNEVLCKFIAHNLCCLIHEECELGIQADFRPANRQDVALTI
jgi:hypothetical protein